MFALAVLVLFLAFSSVSSITDCNKVCIVNDAGFDMNWFLKDFINDKESKSTDTYPIDQSRCLYMEDIPDVKINDIVICRVNAIAGETLDCATAVQYKDNNETAVFVCKGTTLDYGCNEMTKY